MTPFTHLAREQKRTKANDAQSGEKRPASAPPSWSSQAVTNSMPKRRASWKWRLKWHWSLLDLLIEPTLRMKSSSFLLTHALEPALVLLVHELKTPAALGPVLLAHHLGFELGSLAHRPLARVVAGGLVNGRVLSS